MHLIQQNTFDIQCSSPDFGKEIQNQLGSLLEKQFYPKLEILFNKYAIDKHTRNLDSITLELPNISGKNWKNELIHHSLQQIEEYLKNNISLFKTNKETYQKDSSKVFTSNEQHLRILLFHFLKTGTLTENSFSKNLVEIVSKIEITTEFLEELIKNLIEDSTCFERWIFSIPDFFKRICIDSFVGFQLIAKEKFYEIIENQKTDLNGIEHLKQQFKTNKAFLMQWLEVLEWTNYIQKKSSSKQLILETFIELSLRHWAISLEEMAAVFRMINVNDKTDNKVIFQEMSGFVENSNQNNTSVSFKNDFKNTIEKSKNSHTGETQFITNAGLVILHPFLKSLFEQLHLCENDIWTNNINQHKAVLLTQFMITGQEKSFENELFLNKILCGFPLESVVNTQLKITKKEKEKCYSLLEAVSEHWKVMQKSSVEALQESFLQRNGKIVIHSETHFELWVEEKGFDILLEQLPWGIGMVKTPWMEEYLICNWN